MSPLLFSALGLGADGAPEGVPSLELFFTGNPGTFPYRSWGQREWGCPFCSLTLCLLQTDQQAEARSYLSEEMIAGE